MSGGWFGVVKLPVRNLARRTGGVLKRSTRADCKSAGYAFGGSNPPPSTTSKEVGVESSLTSTARRAEGRMPGVILAPPSSLRGGVDVDSLSGFVADGTLNDLCL